MSTVKVNLVEPRSGTTLTLGASGDTVDIPSGVTIANSGTATGFGSNAPYWHVYLSADEAISNNTWSKAQLLLILNGLIRMVVMIRILIIVMYLELREHILYIQICF